MTEDKKRKMLAQKNQRGVCPELGVYASKLEVVELERHLPIQAMTRANNRAFSPMADVSWHPV